MDFKWTYSPFINIVLIFIIPKTTCKEYYCTTVTSWTSAMGTCLKAGGVPVSYIHLMNNKDLNIRQDTTVWTADYIRQQTDTDVIPQTTRDYDCGYIKLKKRRWTDGYHSPDGVQHGNCALEKPYFCETNSNAYLTYHEKTNWTQAYQLCPSGHELWTESTLSSELDLDGTEMWVRSVRPFSHETVGGHFSITNSKLINCGTNDKPVARVGERSCSKRFRAVCAFDETKTSSTFTRTCFEEMPTTVSTEGPALVTSDTARHLENITLLPRFDNATFKAKPDPAVQSNIIVIVTSIVVAIIACIVIGMLLICLLKRRRRRRFNDKSTRVIYSTETLQTISGNPNGTSYSIDTSNTGAGVREYYNTVYAGDIHAAPGDAVDALYEPCENSYEYTDLEDFHQYKHDNNASRQLDRSAGGDSTNKAFRTSQRMNNSVVGSKTASVDSEYDTTNNVKYFQDSGNIYNHLGCDTMESVYDSSESNSTKHPRTGDIYSTTSMRDGVDTESVYDSGDRNKKQPSRSNTDNPYSSMSMRDVHNSTHNTEPEYDIGGDGKEVKQSRLPTDNLYSTTSMQNGSNNSTSGLVGHKQILRTPFKTDQNVCGYTAPCVNDQDKTYGNLDSTETYGNLGQY